MKELELLHSLIFWGPGAVIAGLIILAVFRVTKTIGLEFIRTQQASAAALAKQAQSMEGLRESIHGFVTRENGEHREMIILLKVVADSVKGNRERIEKNGDRLERIEKERHDEYRKRAVQTG